MLNISACVRNFRNFHGEITGRRGRDENRCSGSGLSEHFISGMWVATAARHASPQLVHHYYLKAGPHLVALSQSAGSQWTRAASRSGHASRFLEYIPQALWSPETMRATIAFGVQIEDNGDRYRYRDIYPNGR